MTLEMLSFLLGALLALIGILGGGLEIKELKVPKLSISNRLFALVGGLVFIGLGIVLQHSDIFENVTTESEERPVYRSDTPEVKRSEVITRNVKTDLIADATLKYWNDVHKLDKSYESRLKAMGERSKRTLDVKSQIQLYDEYVELMNESVERESALPVHNVDMDVANLFSHGRQIVKRFSRNLGQKAYLLRHTTHLTSRGRLVSPNVQREIMANMQRLDDETQRLLAESERYESDIESLRVKLTQKYNREFPVK